MIVTLSELKENRVAPLVMACGCFDVLTIGHVRHLRYAARLGNCVVVLVTADRHVGKPGRPIFGEAVRAEVIDCLKCVDYVIVNPHPTAVEAIRFLQPAIFLKGGEYKDHITANLAKEMDAIDAVGGRLIFTNGLVEAHTTDTLRRLGL